MKYLFVLRDPPYGTERTDNGIRWARRLLDADPANQVRVFNFGDAVVAVTVILGAVGL
ncbi:DsrE family protein [Mycobacterium sp. THU-M104]|uniref:DsrE family protein n=1 Tax=Mycobacterium sp. THU-M104 TaxID=3410515 RepID=UPI003B99D84D